MSCNQALVLLALIAIAASAIPVPAFAQGLVNGAPRTEITLNGNWSYVLNQTQNMIPASGWLPARVPALPRLDGTTSVWYKRAIHIPSGWVQPGRSFFVELEKAGHYAAIYWNRQLVNQHYGQFSPFEVDITSFIVAGQENEIEVYVHKADTTYIRPGVNINQSRCPINNPDCVGNAYRSAIPAGTPIKERNWVGLVGDIRFSWRPTENVSDVFVISSVRNMTLQAQLQVTGGTSATTAQATVLDGSTPVLTLPAQPVVGGQVTLQAPWSNPVFWGPTPYGSPKLYMLRTQLLESGKIIDTVYTRFGFREVWVSGKDIMLNGQRLWLTTQMPDRLAPIRYVNDRRPQAFLFHISQASGLNGYENHWDDAGEDWLEVADEMGILMVGTFFCDGRPGFQSDVDSATAWGQWMASTATEWTKARRNHPSIILWRPLDVLPNNLSAQQGSTIVAGVDQAVRSADPSTRPIGDGQNSTDFDTWLQPIEDGNNQCDNGQEFQQKLASETRPLWVREIYGATDLPCVPGFFSNFYGIDYTGGGSGLNLQLLFYEENPFASTWFSVSGRGNRPNTVLDLPEWITRQWTPTTSSTQFAGLYEQYFQPKVLDTSPTSGDLQWSGLPQSVETAFLVSSDGIANPIGVLAAEDANGTAWFVVPEAGNYKLTYTYNGQDVVKNVVVTAPPPF